MVINSVTEVMNMRRIFGLILIMTLLMACSSKTGKMTKSEKIMTELGDEANTYISIDSVDDQHTVELNVEEVIEKRRDYKKNFKEISKDTSCSEIENKSTDFETVAREVFTREDEILEEIVEREYNLPDNERDRSYIEDEILFYKEHFIRYLEVTNKFIPAGQNEFAWNICAVLRIVLGDDNEYYIDDVLAMHTSVGEDSKYKWAMQSNTYNISALSNYVTLYSTGYFERDVGDGYIYSSDTVAARIDYYLNHKIRTN